MNAADYKSIVGVIPYQKKDWRGPARQSFFWYDNEKDLKRHVFAAHAPLYAGNQVHRLSITNHISESDMTVWLETRSFYHLPGDVLSSDFK